MKREMNVWFALLPMIGLIISAALAVFTWDVSMHIPVIIGVVLASGIAFICGHFWQDIQEMMVRGVSRALPAVFILFLDGMIDCSWIDSCAILKVILSGAALIETINESH